MSEKYSDDGPFIDPVVRCTECSKIVYRTAIKKIGKCPHCGNRRVRKVSTLNEIEMKELQDKGIDKQFIALFGEVKDV